MQALEKPVGLPKGITRKKFVLLILANMDNPARRSDIVDQYIKLIHEYEGKVFDEISAATKVGEVLKGLITGNGQVRRVGRGVYEITYNGIVALRYLDMKWGIPKELKPPNLHDYYSPYLDDKKKSTDNKKPKSKKKVKRKR